MNSPSNTSIGPASAASPGAGSAQKPRQHWLRTAFGVTLFVGWGILTVVWVASTVYLVAHGTFTAVITAVCAVALLLLLGGMEGLEVSVIDRWQKFWPGARESDLAGWLSARQLFVALIVTAATLLANRSVVIVPGTPIRFPRRSWTVRISLFVEAWTRRHPLWIPAVNRTSSPCSIGLRKYITR